MKKRLQIFCKSKEFEREFRKQLQMLIIVTFGFTIAFTWRQAIFNLSLATVRFFTNIKNFSAWNILASIFIAILILFVIFLASPYLKGGDD